MPICGTYREKKNGWSVLLEMLSCYEKLYYICILCIFVKDQLSVNVWIYLQVLQCVPLVYVSVFCANTTPFWLLWLCNTLWNKEIWCFQICSSLLLQLNNKNEMTQLKMGKRPKYTFLKWRHKQVNRYMKKCSSSLIMRECKSKPQWDRTSCLLEWLVSKRQ